MALVAQLTDLHLTAGADPFGAEERLAATLDALSRAAPRPDALLLTGDLADDGSPEAYAKLRAAVDPLGLPVHVIPGNHDDRDALREAFGVPGAGRVRLAAAAGALRLVGCDSIRPGRPDGALPPEELDWLDAVLAEEPDAPTLVAVHHPPVVTGVGFMDALGIPAEERAGFARVVAGHPQVQLVVCGHVHLSIVSRVGGHPLLIAPSVAGALALDVRPERAAAFATTLARPGFVLHTWADGTLTSLVGEALAPGEVHDAPPAAAALALAAAAPR